MFPAPSLFAPCYDFALFRINIQKTREIEVLTTQDPTSVAIFPVKLPVNGNFLAETVSQVTAPNAIQSAAQRIVL